MNPIDRLVGYFNPKAGLRRSIAREMLQRAYEGASKRDGWNPKRAGASANADHAADAQTLRVRARSLVQNVPYVAQGIRSLVGQTIGTGIIPRWMGTNGKAFDELWRKHARYADADGRTDVYGIQAGAYRAMEVDGEVLVRIRLRRPTDNLPVPIQFQLLEIDWLDSTKNERRGPNTVVNGIEYDVLGSKVAYWLFDSHPGEPMSLRGSLRNASSPVPAESIIHLFAPDRPGQGRGMTRLAPVIATVRDLQVYEDAEQQRKNLETRLGVLASGDINGLEQPARTGIGGMEAGNLGPLAGGGITMVPPGLNLTVVEPKAAPGYVPYVKQKLHVIAAGMGVTYEMLTGDMSEVNFSSARVRQNDFRRDVEMTQWLTIIPTLCNRMCEAFTDAAYLAGLIQRPDYDIEHSPPKWTYVNPQQDVQADLSEIAGGLSSYSEKLRQRGYSPNVVFNELKADLDQLQKDGTLPLLLLLQKGRTPIEAQSEEPKDLKKAGDN